MATNDFPDGVAPDTPGMLPNPPAPEALAPPLTHEDLSWVGGPKGLQPVTAANPDGDYAGYPLSVHPN